MPKSPPKETDAQRLRRIAYTAWIEFGDLAALKRAAKVLEEKEKEKEK